MLVAVMEGEWAPGWEAMGSCSSVDVEDAGGLGWRAELVREGVGEVCVWGAAELRGEGKGCGGALKNRSSS